MALARRSDMRPGQIFAAHTGWPDSLVSHVLVVIDHKSEIDFFTGARCVYGDMYSAALFEVLS